MGLDERLIVYGAYGYTGELIARMAVEAGHRPLLAGRSARKLEPLARELGLEHAVFGLDVQPELDEALAGATAVLHCAGPFSRTSRPMVDACLRTGTHYLDITGELEVFEACAARDADARAAGIVIMPGVGFDVVPTDCLAARVSRRLPSATHLELAFRGLGAFSRGTATTMLENLDAGGAIREDGLIKVVRAAHRTRVIDFGSHTSTCMSIPWGDVSTAYHSTGIPNIIVYMAAGKGMRLGAMASRHLGAVLGSAMVQGVLQRKVDAGPAGPTDEQRRWGRSLVWAEARDEASGQRVVSRAQTPEGYTLTAIAGLEIAERVVAGELTRGGFYTPSLAFGPELLETLDGVSVEDL